jgi:hypothetical protein
MDGSINLVGQDPKAWITTAGPKISVAMMMSSMGLSPLSVGLMGGLSLPLLKDLIFLVLVAERKLSLNLALPENLSAYPGYDVLGTL